MRLAVGLDAGEQPVGKRAQAEHVGGDRHRFAAHLLGGGVVRREQALAVGGLALAHLAHRRGDAEVDQLRLPVGADQHVARLDVPVHHQLAVRARHRGDHHLEQAHARAQVQPVRVAVLGDGHPAHQLHRDPGLALTGADADVDEAGDRRVLQAREELGLAEEARPPLGADRAAQQLHGHRLRHPVGALGAVDRAHAAGAQALEQPEVAVLAAAAVGDRRVGAAQQGTGHRDVGAGDLEQALHVGGQGRIGAARRPAGTPRAPAGPGPARR